MSEIKVKVATCRCEVQKRTTKAGEEIIIKSKEKAPIKEEPVTCADIRELTLKTEEIGEMNKSAKEIALMNLRNEEETMNLELLFIID